MGGRRFPTIREDGTAEVAARYTSSTHSPVERAFARWHERRSGELADEFSPAPYVSTVGDEVLIVFPIRANARLWKDYMVEATREVDDAGGQCLGFVDRVSGRPHHVE